MRHPTRLPLLTATGPESMRRVSIVFLVAGALAAFAGSLVPDPDMSDRPGLLILAAACALLAAILTVWRRPPAAVLASVPAVGLLINCAAVAVARPIAMTPTYALLALLASAYFAPTRRVALEVVGYGIALGVVLAVWSEPEVRTAVWIGSMIPAICVTAVVVTLKRRLDEHVEGLHDLASTDALTGLLNHGAFGAELERALDASRHSGECAALLLLDIDYFKSVNDRFGHQQGDQTLRLVGGVLAGHKRRGDLLGRLGGDEFGLLLSDADVEVTHRVAERIRAAVRSATEETQWPLTVSIGVAGLAGHTGSAEELLAAADRALYAAKAQGRDRAVAFQGLHAVA